MEMCPDLGFQIKFEEIVDLLLWSLVMISCVQLAIHTGIKNKYGNPSIAMSLSISVFLSLLFPYNLLHMTCWFYFLASLFKWKCILPCHLNKEAKKCPYYIIIIIFTQSAFQIFIECELELIIHVMEHGSHAALAIFYQSGLRGFDLN